MALFNPLDIKEPPSPLKSQVNHPLSLRHEAYHVAIQKNHKILSSDSEG